jgi:hypothetical protein
MKRIVVVIGLIPSLVAALSLTDYEADKSSAMVFYTGLNYHFKSTEGNTVINSGDLTLNFERFQASLPWSYNLSFIGNFNANFIPVEPDADTTDTTGTDTTETAAGSVFEYQGQWEAKYNKYFISGKDFLGFARLDGDMATSYDNPAARATVGVGFGRFTNATSLAQALRMEERMLAENVLIDSLPIGSLLGFSRHLAPETRRDYKDKYYYWEREYYAEIERLLGESNLLENSELGSAGSLIIDDVLDEFISPRYYGYEVNLGVGYDLIPAYTADGRAAFASLAFNYARPLGFRTQLIEKSGLRLPFTSGKFGQEIHGSLLLSLSYEIGSILDLIGTYQLKLDNILDDSGSDYQLVAQNQLSGTFAYLIVDRLVMSNTLTLNHSTQAEGLSTELTSAISFRFF